MISSTCGTETRMRIPLHKTMQILADINKVKKLNIETSEINTFICRLRLMFAGALIESHVINEI